MKPSQRYRLNRLADTLVTPERFERGDWPSGLAWPHRDPERRASDLRRTIAACNFWSIPSTRSPLERE